MTAFTPAGGDGAVMAARIKNLILDRARTSPRSLQRAIGPSELGSPCTRKLAYKIYDWPRANTDGDPWSSIQGTAGHMWMAELFEQQPDAQRYLIERRVIVREGPTPDATIAGSVDLYDRQDGVVWDWKFTGVTSLAKYRREGPGDQYRAQAHLYAYGLEQAGHTPRAVAVCFLPRHHVLDPHVWTEPYDRGVATAALARLDAIRTTALALDPESNPGAWSLFPTSTADRCHYCPWHQPGSTDLSRGCPGA